MTSRRDSSELKTQVDRVRDTNAGPKLIKSEVWREIFRAIDNEAYVRRDNLPSTERQIRAAVMDYLDDQVEILTEQEVDSLCEFMIERLAVHRNQRHGFVWWPKGESDALEE